MKKTLLVAAGLICTCQLAFSMSYEEAMLNRFYFEHASVSSEYCERNNFSTANVLKNWQTKHQSISTGSLRVIRSEMARRGLGKSEQEEVVFNAIEINRSTARKHNVKKPPLCQRFDLQLKTYSDLMVQ